MKQILREAQNCAKALTASAFAANALSGSASQLSTLWNAAQFRTRSARASTMAALTADAFTISRSTCVGAIILQGQVLRIALPSCPDPPSKKTCRESTMNKMLCHDLEAFRRADPPVPSPQQPP